MIGEGCIIPKSQQWYKPNTKEIKKIEPQIIKQLTPFPSHGCLIVVGIKEWAIPDPTGTRAQAFLSLYIGGSGLNYNVVLKNHFSVPRMSQGAPKGWRRKEKYVWATFK